MGTSGQSITLANSIIGVGILAMPFCFQKCGVMLATLMLLLMGLVSRLSCYFLLKSALISRRWNFEFLAFHLFGPLGKLAVEIGIIGFLMGTCIAYFVVVGDLGPQIIAKMLNINQSDVLRTSVMVLVSIVCVLPLGLLKNVDSLSNVSAATVGFYFCLVMKVIAEAMWKVWSGDKNIDMELWKPSGMLQCVPIFSMALFCQTQLFEIFESLPKLSLERMNVVTKNAINICTTVYLTLGLFGYVAFSSQEISGNILVSLSESWISDVIKLGFVMSVAFSFPLIIFPCRASLYSLIYRKAHKSHHDNIINHSIPETIFRCITIGIILMALLISLMIPNIELVLGLVGSTIGVLICVVFPSACFINVVYKNTNEKLIAKLVIMIGLLILILGTYANLQAAESKLDRYDEKYVTQERIEKIVQDYFESKKLQKSEDTIIKPLPINNEKMDKKGKDIIVESEVQPPNPVPPESKENVVAKIAKPERNIELTELKPSLDQEQKLEKPKETHKSKENVIDKVVIDSHIKNVSPKISNEERQSNGINQEEKTKEKIVAKFSSGQDKVDMLKQQQLIDTIKQHGEVQKELIKEQNEILQELAKTKEELQKNQKDKMDTDDAKKIAVESIQKIANIAIQSLGGITEKPNQIEKEKVQKVDSNIENLANNVEEVAKKAVQAIESVKDDIRNNEQLSQQNDAASILKNQHESSNLAGVNIPVERKIVPQEVNEKPQQSNLDSRDQNNKNEEYVDKKLTKAQDEVSQVKRAAAKDHSHSPDEPQSYIKGEDMQLQKNNLPVLSNKIPNVPIPVAMNPNGGINNYQSVDNRAVNENKIPPQSDIANSQQHMQQFNEIQQPQHVNNDKQQQIINNNQQKPQEINSNQQHQFVEINNNQHQQSQQIHQNQQHQPQKTNNGETNVEQNDQENIVFNKDNLLQKNLGNNLQQTQFKDEHVRQKREVIDCTEKSLNNENKQICDTLILNKQQENLLQIPDLTVGLSKSLPLESNLIYHMRSLKNVEIKEVR